MMMMMVMCTLCHYTVVNQANLIGEHACYYCSAKHVVLQLPVDLMTVMKAHGVT